MKAFSILFCFFLPAIALAQSIDTTKVDSSVVRLERDMALIHPRFKLLYVIDDKAYYRSSVTKIPEPTDVLEVKVLNEDAAKQAYGELAEYGAVVIITKEYAIKVFQKKLSSLSKDYKDYLEKNRTEVTDLTYVVDGVPIEDNQFKVVKKLYDIKDEVRTVDFAEKPVQQLNTNNPKPVVTITTKK